MLTLPRHEQADRSDLLYIEAEIGDLYEAFCAVQEPKTCSTDYTIYIGASRRAYTVNWLPHRGVLDVVPLHLDTTPAAPMLS